LLDPELDKRIILKSILNKCGRNIYMGWVNLTQNKDIFGFRNRMKDIS
jgi:hypothetical protein